MLSVPSRDTVLALILLAHLGLGTGKLMQVSQTWLPTDFGGDSESDEWMMTGMAVRMAIDLGLHLVSAPQGRRISGLNYGRIQEGNRTSPPTKDV